MKTQLGKPQSLFDGDKRKVIEFPEPQTQFQTPLLSSTLAWMKQQAGGTREVDGVTLFLIFFIYLFFQ